MSLKISDFRGAVPTAGVSRSCLRESRPPHRLRRGRCPVSCRLAQDGGIDQPSRRAESRSSSCSHRARQHHRERGVARIRSYEQPEALLGQRCRGATCPGSLAHRSGKSHWSLVSCGRRNGPLEASTAHGIHRPDVYCLTVRPWLRGGFIAAGQACVVRGGVGRDDGMIRSLAADWFKPRTAPCLQVGWTASSRQPS